MGAKILHTTLEEDKTNVAAVEFAPRGCGACVRSCRVVDVLNLTAVQPRNECIPNEQKTLIGIYPCLIFHF